MKIQQHFALSSWRKSGSILPQVCHNAQNNILTKLLPWEYGKKMPHCHGENPEFRVWGAMAH